MYSISQPQRFWIRITRAYPRTLLSIFLSTVASIALMGASPVEETDTDTLVIVQFEHGSIDAPFLPYGRPFKISGSTATPEGNANIVYFEIFEKDDPNKKNRYIWIKAKDATDAKFTIIVDHPLDLGTEYVVVARFYTSYNLPKDAQELIKEYTVARLINSFRTTKDIALSEMQLALKEETLRFLKSLGGTEEPKFLQTDFFERIITEIPGSSPEAAVKLAGGEKTVIMAYALQIVLTEERSRIVSTARTALWETVTTYEYRVLIDDLEKVLESASDKGKVPYTDDDIVALRSIDNIQSPLPGGLHALSKMERSAIPSSITNPDLAYLEKIRTARQRVQSEEATYESHKSAEKGFKDHVDKMTLSLLDAYLESLSSHSFAYSFASESKLKKLNVGSNYGLALAYAQDNNLSAFQYVGLTLHLGCVDRDLPNPFLDGQWSHFSILFGFVLGDAPSFDGHQMNKIGKYSPVIGVNYAIYRFVTVDVAMAIVSQPRNPSLSSRSDVRIAPFIGISLDPDLFNSIKEWIDL